MSFLLRLSHAEIPSGSMEWAPSWDWDWNSSSRCYQHLVVNRTKHNQSNPFTSTDPSNGKMDFSQWYCKAFIPFTRGGKLWKGLSLNCGQNILPKSFTLFVRVFLCIVIKYWLLEQLFFTLLISWFISLSRAEHERKEKQLSYIHLY